MKLSNKFTDIDQIDCNGNTVSVFSKAGTKLFSKEFKDNKVIYAVKHAMPKIGKGLKKSENFEEMVCTFLEPETKNHYGSFQSFKYNTTKKNIHLFNKKKESLEINKILFYRQNVLNNLYYDFANTYIINKIFISRTDLDNDGYKDVLFMQTHLYGMFPTANYFISKNNIFHLFNPGPFNTISKKVQNKKTELLLYGSNNLISHLKFIAIKQFHTPITIMGLYKNSSNMKTIMKPSLNKISQTIFDGEIFFISRTSNIIANNWFDKNGNISFVDNQNKKELIQIFKDGRIIRKFDNKIIEFKDKKESLDIVYDCIDKYYKEKMLSKNWNKALKYINEALDVNIKNPWLNSALLNYKGDLYAKINDYQNAIDTLNKSIDIYQGNIDAYQKRCEIEFLKGDIDKSIRLVTGVDDNMSAFWGLLIVGRDLFKSYCYLQKGDFISIEDLIENIYSSATGKNQHISVKNLLESTLEIFNGNYTKAVKTINGLRGKNPTPYTLIEFRLLFSRAVILDSIFNKKNTNQKLLDLAKFYIKDIAINSISSNHLAKISRAYFLAIDGRKREAERMAKEGFEEVLKMSKGDFFTKFWLFYDAFIYGKTMEIIGNQTETLRGYKECIKANPYTDLAKRAKKV